MAEKLEIWIFLVAVIAVFMVGIFVQKSYNTPFAVVQTGPLSIDAPTTVNPSASFQVTYTATDTAKFFVAFTQNVAGGCTPSTYQGFMAKDAAGSSPDTQSFTAPASGTCTFTGYYQFAGDTQKALTPFTVTILENCTPENICQANTCIGQTCTNNCGTVLQGTKTCQTNVTCTNGATQSCTASNTCLGTKTCSNGQWGTCSTSLMKCSDGTCKVTCPTEICLFKLGTFCIKWWYLIIVTAIIVIFILLKKK